MNYEQQLDIQYALAKQIPTMHSVNSHYGTLPLTQDDIQAVQKLLEKRLNKRLEKLNSKPHPTTGA